MSEQAWINIAHVVLAVAALAFATWALVRMNYQALARHVVRAVCFMLIGAFSAGIAVMAILFVAL